LVDVIEVAGLHKHYRRLRGGSRVAVDGLDLAVPEGGVFGFLGPNGAGKTTTIRCLLGLVAPTAGTCRLLGADIAGELHRVAGRVGSIVETPALFPTMSGRRNLELLGRLHGIGPRRVTQTLERVGLAERGDDLAKRYSLGMRQRLGLAAALLKDPEVLLLDEPANGLDPAGIKEVRDLLRGLGADGRTVFVSSHLLSEVRQTCDRVAILARGRCVAAGPVAQVLANGHGAGLLVRLDDLDRGRAVLKATGIQASLHGDALHVAVAPDEAATVTKALAGEGLYLTELRPDEADLEAVFLELTAERPLEVAQ
jgi:ABC-2 type transport system ATP-binding protein